MIKPTIYQALIVKLGRLPTNEEIKADVQRILREGLEELAGTRVRRKKVRHVQQRA